MSSPLFIEIVFNQKKGIGTDLIYKVHFIDKGMIEYLHMELYCAIQINTIYYMDESHRWDASQSKEATHK